MLRSNLFEYIEHTPYNFNKTMFDMLLDNYIENIQRFYKDSNLLKLADYLYSIEYNYIDYEAGAEYAKKNPITFGGCSAITLNGYLAHNYDWYYDNKVDFVVHTTSKEGRMESYGTASIAGLNKNFVETYDWSDLYSILPSHMLDGSNGKIIFCVNVVPTGDYGYTTGTNPGAKPLCGYQIGRYLLDYADSVDNAIELLSNRNIWLPRGQELHFMVADSEKSCIIEFINNEMKVIENGDMMTNFYMYGVEVNNDGTVYTPFTQDETHNAIITNKITPNGNGLERFNILASAKNELEDSEDMIESLTELMTSINYTKAYVDEIDEDTWLTEFVGELGRTVASTPEEIEPILEYAYNEYINRSRETATTWQTVHNAIYDLNEGVMYLLFQEGDSVLEFQLPEL